MLNAEKSFMKELNIKVIFKWKRILINLGDFFINFILAFLIFNIAVTPIGKLMTNYQAKSDKYQECEVLKTDLLYSNGLVYVDNLNYKYDQNTYMKYTYDLFLSYYVISGSEDFLEANTPYGKIESNEVVKHYYFNILNNEGRYYELFNKYNSKVGYFIIEGTSITLKEEHKEQLLDNFNKKSELSEVGKTLYDDVASGIFFALFAEILTDISIHDLTHSTIEYSYNYLYNLSNDISNYHLNLLTICSLISYFISSLVVYLIYPLINKNRRTITMSVMKFNRISISNFSRLKKPNYIALCLYGVLSNLLIPLFLPITLVSVAYIFNYTLLVYAFVIGGLFAILSLITLLFDYLSRTIADKLTNSVIISEEDLFEIYKAKGYILKDGKL